MFKIKKIIVLVLMCMTAARAYSKEEQKVKKWFENSACEEMKVIEYKSASDKTVVNEVTLVDADYVTSFQAQISQLPTAGEEMIKMGPHAQRLVLEFICKAKTEKIEFYNERIKTPDTSFYAGVNKNERAIWFEIQTLLKEPAFGQAVPKVKSHDLNFAAFTIRYIGRQDRTQKGTTATSFVETFKVKDSKNNSETTVEVQSGQLPPQDVNFAVGEDKYVLRTFKNKKGESLYPRQMVIDRR